jgi:hypothetical protein
VITVDVSVGDVLSVEAAGFWGVLGEDVVEEGSGLSCLRAAVLGTVVVAVVYATGADDGRSGTMDATFCRNRGSWELGLESR